MNIDIKKIREQYMLNQVWEQKTKEELKQEILKVLGSKEWHFEPRSYDESRTDKMAGARVVNGVVQYCSSGTGSWVVRKIDGKEERIATWLWLNWRYQHISWWLKMAEILKEVEDFADRCEPIQGNTCTKDYKKPFEGVQELSII